MFDSLTDRLGDVFDRLRRHGALSENDVGAAMREIRVASHCSKPMSRCLSSAISSRWCAKKRWGRRCCVR